MQLVLFGVQKKKAVAKTATAATSGPRSNFAEFRRQMKLKQKAAAAATNDGNDENDIQSQSSRPSGSMSSPRRQSNNTGMYVVTR